MLPCHARCLFHPEDQDILLELSEHCMNDGKLAAALGVTRGVLKANTVSALKRRAIRQRAARAYTPQVRARRP